MELISFRIKNYRSIIDSKDFFMPGDNLSILAGKNESGKTAILEALEDININEEIRKDAVPINKKNATPEIIINFKLTKEELEKISNDLNLDIKKNDLFILEISKTFPNKYSISDKCKKEFGINDENYLKRQKDIVNDISNTFEKLREIKKSRPEFVNINLPELNIEDLENFKAILKNFHNSIVPNLNQIQDNNIRNSINNIFLDILNFIDKFQSLKSLDDSLIEMIKKFIPNFILFSTFDDVLPKEIPFSEALNNSLIKDLDIISNLDLKTISSGEITQKTKHREQLNIRVNEEYKKFWTQDLTDLHIEWENNNIYFLIREGDDFYPHSIRSKGKQWHMAFYIRVSARSIENIPNIILIDEPGLFLHAKAQKDILKKLEDSAINKQVIFSTHSPYLIKIDKLNRIRLVTKDKTHGTTISNKIHKNADKESLTPIITAIGLDLSQTFDIAKNNNIILEGISDYYYISAFIKLFKKRFNKEVHLIPCVGANNTIIIFSLMVGWGLNYCLLLDNDKKGKKIKDYLENNFKGIDPKVISVSENNDECIEDLFTREDFITYVLEEKLDNIPNKSNSQIKKDFDNVLRAKNLFEKVEQVGNNFSEATKNNFEKLIKKIYDTLFQ